MGLEGVIMGEREREESGQHLAGGGEGEEGWGQDWGYQGLGKLFQFFWFSGYENILLRVVENKVLVKKHLELKGF